MPCARSRSPAHAAYSEFICGELVAAAMAVRAAMRPCSIWSAAMRSPCSISAAAMRSCSIWSAGKGAEATPTFALCSVAEAAPAIAPDTLPWRSCSLSSSRKCVTASPRMSLVMCADFDDSIFCTKRSNAAAPFSPRRLDMVDMM